LTPETASNRYAEIFDLAPVARLITDRLGVVQEANQAAMRLLATSGWRLVGKPLALFVPSDDRREFRQRLLDSGATTQPTSWSMWLRTEDGRPFRGELSVAGSATEPDLLHWAISDVTEHLAMAEELRLLAAELEARVEERTAEVEAERARLAAVIEHIPAGLTISDGHGRVVTANAEARRLLGDDLGRGVPPTGLPDSGRAGIERTDGSRVVLDLSVGPIADASGKAAGEVRLFQDVSERERQDRAERDFVTNAAHQLQSPLAAILSAIEVLQSGAKDRPERDVFLGHIERESTRLARLVRALLILARAQTGFEAPKDEVVSLRGLLDEVAASVRPREGVTVEVECDHAAAVVANRELLEQALLNVAENASKYTKEGKIALEARLADDVAELVVSDTGAGIPSREQDRVLERFYRAAPNGSDGFGLGFAIVRSAMEAIGGELEIDSVVGAGTTVTLRLRKPASLVET
jgi:PAS domain S-box-containing protein